MLWLIKGGLGENKQSNKISKSGFYWPALSLKRATLGMKMNIKDYMQKIGQQARVASRAMAKADTNTKNLALTTIAQAIIREQSALLDRKSVV